MNKISRFIISILYLLLLYPFWIGLVPYLLGIKISEPNYIGASAFVMGVIFPYIIANIYEKRGNSWWKIFLISGFFSTGIPIIGIIWVIISFYNKNKITLLSKISIFNRKSYTNIDLLSKIDYKQILIKSGLDEYINLFEKNRINEIKILLNLKEEDYEKIGVNIIGDRKRMISIFSFNEIMNFYKQNKIIEKVKKSEIENTTNNNLKIDEFLNYYNIDIENNLKIKQSELFQLSYKELYEKLLWLYPVSIGVDIDRIEKVKGFEFAKDIIINLLNRKNYGT